MEIIFHAMKHTEYYPGWLAARQVLITAMVRIVREDRKSPDRIFSFEVIMAKRKARSQTPQQMELQFEVTESRDLP